MSLIRKKIQKTASQWLGDRKINLTITIDELDMGGAQHVVYELVKHLDYSKYNATIICTDGRVHSLLEEQMIIESEGNYSIIFLKKHDFIRIGSVAFFKKWHELWLISLKRGCSQDSPALNHANYDCDNIISKISGEWNCQIGYGGLQFLAHAKIIHYFATELVFFTTPYSLASNNVLSSIKENGVITDTILNELKNPLSAFEPNARIFSDIHALSVINSSMFAKLIWLKKSMLDL